MNKQTFYNECTNKLYAMFVRADYIVYIEMLYSIVVLLKVSQVVVELTPTLTLSMYRSQSQAKAFSACVGCLQGCLWAAVVKAQKDRDQC